MAFETFLQENGWIGFIVYVLVREGIPFFRDRIYPEKLKEKEAERERCKRLDERQAKAFESMSQAVHEMALAITANNERLSQSILDHAEHSRFVHESISAMRERVSRPNTKIRK